MKYIKQATLFLAIFLIQINAFAQTTDSLSIWVNGACSMCMDRIEEVAMQTLGVETASWDEDTRMLSVTTNNEFVENNLHYAVTGVGHDTKKFLASDEVYEELYACCKYRELRDAEEDTTESTEEPENPTSIWVNDACSMCMDRIEEAAMQTLGVETASWDEDTRILNVTTNADFEENNLHYAVTGVGHDTKKFLASDEAYEGLYACCKYRELRDVEEAATTGSTANQVSIWVDGICGMCEERIEGAAMQIMGVETASWDVVSKMLTVSTNADFEENNLHYAVTGVGHDTKKFLASEEIYENLHACCKYKDLAVIEAHNPIKNVTPTEVRGTVNEFVGKKGKRKSPLTGASVFWLGDEMFGTTTDVDGTFSLPTTVYTKKLVVSYVGYAADTIDFTGQYEAEITLANAVTLEDVEVTYRRKATEISFIDPIKVQQISSKELTKAACCNLSESFETNPSVDVSFTDAVTGTRQIQMLGLAGPYVQITRELIPDARALASIQGLTFTPGPWIESIQLAKGAGSVSNGFESMTGQINVELKKPEESENFFFNAYQNVMGRSEVNTNFKFQLNDQWSTGFLLHGSRLQAENDRNEDGFYDQPNYNNFIGINRWRYQGDNNWEGQAGVKIFVNDHSGGQIAPRGEVNTQLWSAVGNTKRFEAWAKAGRIFPNRPGESFGSQFNVVSHTKEDTFGNRQYLGEQRSFYGNLLYQGIIGTTLHQYKTGVGLTYDDVRESLNRSLENGASLVNFDYQEIIPGAFFEYTWLPDDAFTLVAGLRYDHHNFYGSFITPRLHLRYAPSENTVLRASIGSGRRTARLIAENLGRLASSRTFIGAGLSLRNIEELDQEAAWNFGLNLTQNAKISDRDLILSLDTYHTRFQQQIVIDVDAAHLVRFYNLTGESYSTSLQAQVDYELLSNFDIRLAYRFNDVKVDYLAGQREMPFVSKHRAFINAAYELNESWMFDATLNWRGSQRIPDTNLKVTEYQLSERAPDFFLLNAQVSKNFGEKFSLYVGGENLLNFRQQNPILAANDPFSNEFDASLVWGPIFGRNVYTGLRLTL
ncbi:MAG: TonB-dependent receptor [Saprospiraceae bacterium]